MAVIALNPDGLTERQRALALEARAFPVIVSGHRLNTARCLARKLWGEVESGAGNERIFRLGQFGCDALAHTG